MSVRFTSGGIGRLTFEHANRIAEATDRVAGIPVGGNVASEKIRPVFIVARLVQKTSQTFGPEDYEVWTWSEIGVNGTPSSRTLGPIPKGLASTDFNNGLGRAVCMYGTAKPLDNVVLFPIKDVTGETWYAFAGSLTPSGVTSVLQIQSAFELAPGYYRYQVTPIYMAMDGSFTPNANLPSGPAFNLYELSGWHGQKATFTDPASTLVPDGPVTGYVLGVLSNEPDDDVAWAFEAPLPLRPECDEPTPGVQDAALRGGL